MSSKRSPTKNGTATAIALPSWKAAHAVPDAASPAGPPQVLLIQPIPASSPCTAAVSRVVSRRTRRSAGGAGTEVSRTAITRSHVVGCGSTLRNSASQTGGAPTNPVTPSSAPTRDGPGGEGDPDGQAVEVLRIGGNQIAFGIIRTGIDTPTAGHIHPGATGVIGLVRVPFFGVGLPGNLHAVTGSATVTDGALLDALRADPGSFYVNPHTLRGTPPVRSAGSCTWSDPRSTSMRSCATAHWPPCSAGPGGAGRG